VNLTTGDFTKRKFLLLNPYQRHKKCAQLLRRIYECIHSKQPLAPEPLLDYNTYLSWMRLDAFSSTDLRALADRYHWHLNQAGLSLKEHNLLPHIRTGDHTPKTPFPDQVAIYLDHVRSAYNVGSILRTTEALRIGQVYFSEKTPFIDNEKVYRTAMGGADLVPCHQNATLSTLPRPLIVLDTSDDAIPVSEFLFPPSFTLILGNEEYGVSQDSLRQADYFLEIPLVGAKNSLNVACAFAITAAEIQKQKLKGIAESF